MPQAIIIQIAIALVMTAISFAISALLKPSGSNRALGGDLKNATVGTTITQQQAAQPRQIIVGEVRTQGDIVFKWVTRNKQMLNLVIAWAGHEVNSLGKLYFDAEEVTFDESGTVTGKYAGNVVFHDHLGTDDQLADAALIAEAPDKWTDEHRGRGVAYTYIRISNNPSLFPQGEPNIWRVAQGKKFYDPRTDETVYTSNAALVQAGYLADPKYGIGAPYDTEHDLDALSAAANICDETVNLADGTTEKRYAANGTFRCDRAPADVITDLLSASLGKAVLAGGMWVLRAGAWQVPTLTFGPDDFRDVFSVQNLLGNQASFTAVKGKYNNPDANYQLDDFPAVISQQMQDDAGLDLPKFKDVSLPFTVSPATAQRIAKADLNMAAQPITFTAPFNLSGLQIQAGNYIYIDFDFLGWGMKAFEALEVHMKFGTADGAARSAANGGMGVIGVDVDLREVAEDMFFYDPTTDERRTDPAPNSTLPTLFDVDPPSNLAVDEQLYSTRDGAGVKTSAVLTWNQSPDGYVTGYRVRYRLAGGDWIVHPDIAGLALTLEDLAPGAWEFAVAAVNRVTTSDYISQTKTIAGLLAPPADPTGLDLSPIGGIALLRWDETSDLDVRIGGQAVFKHSPATSGATWEGSTSIGKAVPGSATHAGLPLKAGTYLVKFRDSSGIYSTGFASFVTDQDSATAYTTIDTLTEDPSFTGSKTNCSEVSSKLKMTPGETGGTYLFASTYDAGSVQNFRLTGILDALIVNNTDDIGLRAGNVGSWASFGAEVTGLEADAHIEVRKTSGDPGGSPTWSAWQRLDSLEQIARAFEFRLVFESTDTNYGVEVTGLGVVIEQVS